MSLKKIEQCQDQFAAALYDESIATGRRSGLLNSALEEAAYHSGEDHLVEHKSDSFEWMRAEENEAVRDLLIERAAQEQWTEANRAIGQMEHASDPQAAEFAQAYNALEAVFSSGLRHAIDTGDREMYHAVSTEMEALSTRLASAAVAAQDLSPQVGAPTEFRGSLQIEGFLEEIEDRLDNYESNPGMIDQAYHAAIENMVSDCQQTLDLIIEAEGELDVSIDTAEEYERVRCMADGIRLLTQQAQKSEN